MEIKSTEVLIGNKKYRIKELTCMNRNALLDIIGSFTFAEMLKSVMPLLEELGIKLDSEDGENDQVGKLIRLGLQNEAIWGGLMACLINVLRVGPEVICLSLDCVLDNETQDYVTENLTIRQEPVIIKQIIEINKLPETIKNYKSLLAEVKNLKMTS